jgi:hypothetical protein
LNFYKKNLWTKPAALAEELLMLQTICSKENDDVDNSSNFYETANGFMLSLGTA